MSAGELATITSGGFEGFSAPDAALLRMSDALAETPANVSDELYAELRRHFSEDHSSSWQQSRVTRTCARERIGFSTSAVMAYVPFWTTARLRAL